MYFLNINLYFLNRTFTQQHNKEIFHIYFIESKISSGFFINIEFIAFWTPYSKISLHPSKFSICHNIVWWNHQSPHKLRICRQNHGEFSWHNNECWHKPSEHIVTKIQSGWSSPPSKRGYMKCPYYNFLFYGLAASKTLWRVHVFIRNMPISQLGHECSNI